MQTPITKEEKARIKKMTAHYGATGRFLNGSGISWNALDSLRTKGRADETIVSKVREYLKGVDEKEAQAA